MKIIVPDPIDLTAGFKQKLRADFDATLYGDVPATSQELITRIKDAELITANYVDITADIIDGAPNLRYIVVPAVGYEWIDVAYATSKGITVVNCPTFNGQAVAEHAMALLLAVSRKLTDATTSLKQGRWDHDRFTGTELHGKRLGLIGYGNIGRKVEKLVSGFGMQISLANSKTTADEIDTLLRESDVICICAPLTAQTHHMIDERRLALLKGSALLINVGRGAIIDQAALIETLSKGAVAGAGLDVFEDEPLKGQPSEAIIKLANLPNVVATPHMAYNTQETAERLGHEMYDNIQACLAGQPINVITH